MMKLIVGLGNPGLIYRNARHNIGIRTVKRLAKEFQVKLSEDKSVLSKVGRGRIKSSIFILAYPLVFMNLSGKGINSLLKKYKVSKENLLVICDDLDLDLGKIRLKARGSSGGHKGLQSIIDCIGTSDFARLRIGIGRPSHKDKIRIFVLSAFDQGEAIIIKDIIKRAVECCQSWLSESIHRAMNRFN